MPLALRIPLLLLFLAVSGLTTLPLFGRSIERLSALERWLLAAVLGVGLSALAALLLAVSGVYSLGALLGLVLGWSALAVVLGWKRRSWRLFALPAWKQWLPVLVLLIAATAIFSPPSHLAFGGFDVGVYANIAANIQREGRITATDQVVAGVEASQRDLLYLANNNSSLPYQAREFQGYYITDFVTGQVVPQFFHLWPALMAIFASFLGTAGMFWAVTLVAVLAALALFLLVKRYLGLAAAIVAGLLTLTFMPMVYFSKYSTSEMLDLALFLAALLTLAALLEPGEETGSGTGLAVLGGLFVVLGMLTRIDFLFVAAPLGLLFVYRVIMGTARRSDYAFLGMLGLGLAAGLGYGFLFSRPYTATVLGGQLGGRLASWIPWVLVGVILLALCLIFRRRARVILVWLGRRRRFIVPLAAFALIAGAAYLYFIRPSGADSIVPYVEELNLRGPSFVKDTFIRWGWYFSWLGLLLAVGGYAAWLARQKRFSSAVPWVVGMFFSVVYVSNMRNIPLHILVMRRSMPIIFPIAILMICYALVTLRDYGNSLSRRWLRVPAAGWALAAFALAPLLVFFVLSSRPVFGLNEGAGELSLTGDVAAVLEPGSVLLISPWLGNLAGPPLRYFEGIQTARLTSYDTVASPGFPALLAGLAGQGSVYLLWDNTQDMRMGSGVRATQVGVFADIEKALEASFEHRPQEVMENLREYSLYRLTPAN